MRALYELSGFFSSKWDALKTLTTLIRLEAKLAALSVMPLVVCLLLLMIVATTTWLVSLLLIGYGLWWWLHNMVITLLSLLLVNLLIGLGLFKKIIAYLKQISFTHTRSCLSSTTCRHHEQTKTTTTTNSLR